MDNTATASFMGVGEGKNQAHMLFQQKPTMPDVETRAKLPGKGNYLCFVQIKALISPSSHWPLQKSITSYFSRHHGPWLPPHKELRLAVQGFLIFPDYKALPHTGTL